MMMDDETLQMYVEEASEHLGDIENDLLTIEQAGANIDEELVNKVFRAAHSIKGGAGFLGLTAIKDLGHKIENVLDMMRNRELVPEPEIVNVVLLAFDRLRDLIANVAESNDADIEEHLVALTAVATHGVAGLSAQPTGSSPQMDVPPVSEGLLSESDSVDSALSTVCDRQGRPVFVLSATDEQQYRKGGKNLYLLTVDLVRDTVAQGKSPLELLQTLESAGVIHNQSFDIEGVGPFEEGRFINTVPLHVLFGSIIEDDILPALLGINAEGVFLLPEHLPTSATSETTNLPEVLPEAESFVPPTPVASAPPAAPAVPKITPAPAPPVPAETRTSASSAPAEKNARPALAQPESLRVHVSLLEDLMNLAGELVLSRNQLMQAITSDSIHQIEIAGQRIDLVTSELQETIMLTRMQTIGTIFNKFPRVVRDLARSLGKEIDLQLEGNEVELDKTIIEGLGDPLTHLVRNSADHGVEIPAERIASGKSQTGTIVLKAYHEAGQVIIEIVDDGRGLNTEKIAAKALAKELITAEQLKTMSEKEQANLIFLPGLSTAEAVTDVSGRGVGMDVVKSNLDQLGGQVDIETSPGKGTTIRIKLPLTLAIIPSLLVSIGKERYAIPQVNVDELLRVPMRQIRERLEMVGDAEVLMLRGELIPLLHLSTVLNLEGEARKASQSISEVLHGEVPPEEIEALADVNLVVVSAGQFRYGLVVNDLHDSVEIVVKPLGRHFKECAGYAGATIMGDGHVALILDVAGLGRLGDLNMNAVRERAQQAVKDSTVENGQDKHSFFLFRNMPHEHCAVPLDLVARVELIKAQEIEEVGGRRVVKYRGGTLPVFSLDQAANVGMLELTGELVIIVFVMAGHEIGLLANAPVDAIELRTAVDGFTLKQPGIAGSVVINGNTTLLVDIFELIEMLQPDWFATRETLELESEDGEVGVPHLLLVEDSDFFRNQVKRFLEEDGYTVEAAEDGLVAWHMLDARPDAFDLILTDIEMPNMDGLALSARIRSDERFSTIPIVALTSLAADEDVERGYAAGIDEYQVKLDKERLLQGIYNCLQRYANA